MIEKTEMSIAQKRNVYVDFLKGIAIILMVVGHSISDIHGVDIFFNFIYSFHMPLLFFASAYIEEQNKEKYMGREKRMLLRRMRGLLVPYISWTVLFAIVSGSLTGVLSDLCGLGRYNELWFFPVLFGLKVMHALYWFICNKKNRNTIFMDVVVLGILGIILVLFALFTRQSYLINMLSYAIPYFFAVFLVKYEVIQKMVSSEWLAAGAIFLYVLLFSHFSFYDTCWITQALRIGLSLCVIIICYKAKDTIHIQSRKALSSFLCVCGENSLAIYVLYGFFIDYKKYFDMIDSIFLVGILSVGLAILVAAVCVMIAKILETSSWCGRLFFGK